MEENFNPYKILNVTEKALELRERRYSKLFR